MNQPTRRGPRRAALAAAALVAAGLAALQAPLTAQAPGVDDVGLTLRVSTLNVIYGQACGPFSCQPLLAGYVSGGPVTSWPQLTIHGAPTSPCILGIALDPPLSPCIAIPGLGNSLILGQPAAVVAASVTSAALPSPSAACRQGRAQFVLPLPPTTPPGIAFTLQAVAVSNATGAPAFTVALALQTL